MSDRMREIRDWATLVFTLISVMVVPLGVLILKNERLEIKDEVSREYINRETYTADHAAFAAQAAKAEAEITEINIKLDRINVNVTRLMDATKLREEGP